MGKETGLRDQKKIQTRRLILKCANQMFRTKGYSSTRLEDIAKTAGVHKQTVLRHFGSKEEIALASRQVVLENFKKGLLDPERSCSVSDYWGKGGGGVSRSSICTAGCSRHSLSPVTIQLLAIFFAEENLNITRRWQRLLSIS